MLQFVAQIIPVILTGLIAYMTYLLSKSFKNAGAGMFREFRWFLEKTPALDAFLMFVLQAVLVAGSVAGAFQLVSNHIILSLDILYFASLLMLILFHMLKEAINPLVKEI